MIVADGSGISPLLPRPLRHLLGPLGTSASGMARQQRFMAVIAENIANADTPRTAEGGPYQRKIAVGEVDPRTGELVTSVATDSRTGRMVYDPGHPDADAAGYVQYPNIDIATETVDLMVARRMHEANATVFQVAKAMLRRALEI